MKRRALITGITGMDGSHLADVLVAAGYEVHGIVRRTSQSHLAHIAHLADTVVLHDGDLCDQGSLDRIVNMVAPHEIYNLAAQSFVGASWQQPIHTAEVTGLGAVRMLEAAREHAPGVRFYQASSSEMFGNEPGPQDEATPMRPRSPYGAAKLYAHSMAVNYRESYDMHVSCGILFNHESERRGREFVTRSISLQVARLALGLTNQITLGNLHAVRDWGYAPDYCRAMWRMVNQDEPGDYVIATGETRTVRDFLVAALGVVGLYVADVNVVLDSDQLRPAELHSLCGDAVKARVELGWEPTMRFYPMVRAMVANDLNALDTDPMKSTANEILRRGATTVRA